MIKEAVVLAAGLSTRMRGFTNLPKQVLKILDKPLIYYPLTALIINGVKKVYVVVNKVTYGPIRKILGGVPIDIEYVINDKPDRDNGYSVILGGSYVKGDYFYLAMSDHIFSIDIPKVLAHYVGIADLVVGADSEPKLIDIEEATKILVKGGNIVKVGKGLDEFTHIDIGIFIMNRKVVNYFKECSEVKYVIKLADLINYSIMKGVKAVVADVKGRFWFDIDTKEDLEKVRSELRDYVENVKGFINYLVKA